MDAGEASFSGIYDLINENTYSYADFCGYNPYFINRAANSERVFIMLGNAASAIVRRFWFILETNKTVDLSQYLEMVTFGLGEIDLYSNAINQLSALPFVGDIRVLVYAYAPPYQAVLWEPTDFTLSSISPFFTSPTKLEVKCGMLFHMHV